MSDGGLTLRAVTSDPAGVALAGAVDGVARAVVGAATAPRTPLPVAPAGTHWGGGETHVSRLHTGLRLKGQANYRLVLYSTMKEQWCSLALFSVVL